MDIPQDINARVRDRDQRFRDRDEMRRERDEHFRKRMAERGHVLPEDMEGEFDAHDLHEEMMKRHRERDGATLARKDITERHKELIDHRQRVYSVTCIHKFLYQHKFNIAVCIIGHHWQDWEGRIFSRRGREAEERLGRVLEDRNGSDGEQVMSM